MIRPRNNGFHYSKVEYAVIRRDVDTYLQRGAAGIAIGFLNQDFSVDGTRTAEIVAQAGLAEIVFHRAFDITPDVSEALEALIDCGVKRILTSGQASTAPEGAEVLAALVRQAAGRIEILPGGGINPSNARRLVEASGCRQLHGTFKKPMSSSAPLLGLDRLRAPAPAGTDSGVVAAVRRAVSA